jgi:shikimate dehydrogenase
VSASFSVLTPDSLAAFVPAPEVAHYAVLGHPVAHSLSPGMQEAGFAAAGIPARYLAIDCPPEALPAVVALLKEKRFAGWNCTIPHKFGMLALCDLLGPSAKEAGAVNTVVNRNGFLSGHSTDGEGWERAVAEAFGRPLSGLRIVVLGAGGSGQTLALRAVAASCRALTIANRTRSRADEVAARVRANVHGGDWQGDLAIVPLDGDLLRERIAAADLVVNTTSLGLHEGDAAPLPAAWFRPGLDAYDLIYRPALTPFLAAAREGGARTANGLGMLLHQGALAWEHWTGRPAPLDVMRTALTTAAA